MTAARPDAAELAEEAQIRANLCRIFAAFFLTPPSEQFLSALASSPITRIERDSSWDVSALQIEFHALFLVPAAQYVFPYESCYRNWRGSRPGRLMGRPALDVQEFYRRVGLDLAPEASELPDHAGVEFSVLQLLADREATAWRDGADEQARHWHQLQMEFLSTHTGLWIPALCSEIAAKTAQPYFSAFADWIRGVVEEAKPAGEDERGLAGAGQPQGFLP